MRRRPQKVVFLLALAAIALLVFTATVDLLPHHHKSLDDERTCPICHAPVMGLQQVAIEAPTPLALGWPIWRQSPAPAHAPNIRRASSRAPPAA